MKKTILTLSLITLMSGNIFAAEKVPAIPKFPNLLDGKDIPLNKKEWDALSLVTKWKNAKQPMLTEDNGKVTFLFGASLPTIVCAPLKVCDLELQPGEVITEDGLHIGDRVRWKVSPALSGPEGHQTTHLIIKPSLVGLETQMVLTTNKRVYHIKLKSHKNRFMPYVGFNYLDEMKQQWNRYYSKVAKKNQKHQIASPTPNGPQKLAWDLDFEYEIEGQAAWKPLRVYNNGVKTIIQMPEAMQQTEAPALLILSDNAEQGFFSDGEQEELVNYRLKNNHYIVDRIFNKAILIAGIGDSQTRITISRKVSKDSERMIEPTINEI